MALASLAALALLSAAPSSAAEAGLVDVAEHVPRAVLDLRYATADNFTGKVLYPTARCLLRREVADRLGMDAFQFSRAFKRVHGIAPLAFVQSRRGDGT